LLGGYLIFVNMSPGDLTPSIWFLGVSGSLSRCNVPLTLK
jgi:hypothetical protein